MEINRSSLIAAGVGIGALIAVYLIATSATAKAADLGGGCCADLEERIAELEATAARKGNRKVTLTVYGQVNAGIIGVDVGDFNQEKVTQNGTDETFVGFAGAGRINGDLSAGYVLELDAHDLGLLNLPVGSNGPRVRQSYWWLKSASLGAVSVGLQGTATQDFDKITTANTSAVTKPLSLGGVSDAYLTGIDLPFDGTYRDVIRYDSPVVSGFMVSASWGNSVEGSLFSPDNGDQWDVALRYAGDFSGFKLAGGLGYRKSTDLEINLLNITNISIPTGDVKTILAVGSIKHVDSGLFLTGNYADQDWDAFGGFTLKGWQATGGIERKWFAAGATTLYGEYGRLSLDSSGPDGDVDLWGVGVVQALDGAAMDLYVGYRNYDLGDLIGDDAQVYSAGARIKF